MGVGLIQEVLDHAPEDITSSEMVVLLVLAESARDASREAWPGMQELARRCRLTPDGVQKVLRRLAGRGIDVRVVVAKDKNGRPMYAARGHRTTYRLPSLGPLRADSDPSFEDNARTTGRVWADERAGLGGPSSDPSRQSRQSPQQRQAILIVTNKTDATEAEAIEIIEAITRDRPDIRNMAAVLGKFDTNELIERLGELREVARRSGIRAWLDAADQSARCDHGEPGGNLIRPDSKEPKCALCRAQARRSA